MKYCLNSRQEAAYLQKADEIKVEFRDRDIISDLPAVMDKYRINSLNEIIGGVH